MELGRLVLGRQAGESTGWEDWQENPWAGKTGRRTHGLGRQAGESMGWPARDRLLPGLAISKVRKLPNSPVPPSCSKKNRETAQVHIWICPRGSWVAKAKVRSQEPPI